VAIFWDSDAECLRYLKTFRAMPWFSKLVTLSFVLFPLGLTWIAYIYRTDGQADNRIWGLYYCWLAGFCWLGFLKEISTYVRGHYAERRGVPPTPPGCWPEPTTERTVLVTLCVVVLLIARSTFLPKHHIIPHPQDRWVIYLLVFSVFFAVLPGYTRKHYRDIELD